MHSNIGWGIMILFDAYFNSGMENWYLGLIIILLNVGIQQPINAQPHYQTLIVVFGYRSIKRSKNSIAWYKLFN